MRKSTTDDEEQGGNMGSVKNDPSKNKLKGRQKKLDNGQENLIDEKKPFVELLDEWANQNSPVRNTLGLYFHRTAIDVVLLVVGTVSVTLNTVGTDMIPVYMIVRSFLRLVCLPFIVACDYVPPMGWKNKIFIAMKVVSSLIGFTIFGWLIYGTVIVLKRWPGSDEDVCNKSCYLTAWTSLWIDWLWGIFYSLAMFFHPTCCFPFIPVLS